MFDIASLSAGAKSAGSEGYLDIASTTATPGDESDNEPYEEPTNSWIGTGFPKPMVSMRQTQSGGDGATGGGRSTKSMWKTMSSNALKAAA